MGDQQDGLNYKIHFEDNSDLVGEQLKLAIQRSLYIMGENAVNSTVEYMSIPDFTGKDIVDTGRLRASISFATKDVLSGANGSEASADDALTEKALEDNSVMVGTNVEYANYVEYGTKKQAARYFLKNGIENSIKKSEEDVKEIMKGGGK